MDGQTLTVAVKMPKVYGHASLMKVSKRLQRELSDVDPAKAGEAVGGLSRMAAPRRRPPSTASRARPSPAAAAGSATRTSAPRRRRTPSSASSTAS